MPAALIGGVLSPILLFFVARRLIGHAMPALVAALVLALAPTHLVLSRQALDYICPIPFLIGWLWSLDGLMRTRRPMFAAVAGLILGVGCYSYIASWGVMPLLLMLTWLLMWRAGHGARPILLSAIAFAVPVSLAPVWIAFHPEMLACHPGKIRHERPAAGWRAAHLPDADRSDCVVRSRRSQPDHIDRAIGFRAAAGRAPARVGSCRALAAPRLDGGRDCGWVGDGARFPRHSRASRP